VSTNLEILTIEQAALRLTIKPYKIRELIRQGRLAALRTGGSEDNPRGIRVTADAVEKYKSSIPGYTRPTSSDEVQ
jgi:excisionase family DNA binding protein